MNPVPFLPYPGMIARLTALLALPVVRALNDAFSDGLRNTLLLLITNFPQNKTD
ncbi:hypothetical protein IMAU30025_01887 [Lactobacillus helveticus]|nr:hypothetical protein FC11_GL000803 [Lactobacillus helveticus DSM 20075 = CGMCC 1.1877]NRN77616.1 hypothetical protein [Lactobacillus helveticus]NRN89938.1 hypothetical protein [Lactobacillus helveticus]NRO63189.1 hypothetical protein [Lactobacillus helveticus]